MARSGNNTRISKIGQYAQTTAATFGTDLTELANNVADVIGESVANVAALPSSGNWAGRTIHVVAEGAARIWDGSAWKSQAMRLAGVGGKFFGSGTAPAIGAPILFQAGSDVLTLNATGWLAFTFPTAFPNGILSVTATNGDNNSRPQQTVSVTAVSLSVVNFQFISGTAQAGTGAARINWIAVGW